MLDYMWSVWVDFAKFSIMLVTGYLSLSFLLAAVVVFGGWLYARFWPVVCYRVRRFLSMF